MAGGRHFVSVFKIAISDSGIPASCRYGAGVTIRPAPSAAPATATAAAGAPSARRWVVLCAGLTGQIAACCFQYGLPFLVPSFRAAGLSLTQASAMVSAPIVGVLCALFLWGAVADRLGERWVLAGGLAGAAGALMLAAAATAHPLLLAPLLCVAGASAACVHVVSGRLILGWFPPNERGLAMGLRQTGQPIGVGVAALALPRLGGHGLSAAMLVLAAGCALAALLIVAGVRDVRRATGSGLRAGSPYRGSYLWRVHAAGALMVVPQFGVAVFAYDYLVSGRGWSAGSAGALLAASQVFGAGSRLGSGWWSDHAGTRLGPMRTICLATAAVLGLLAIGAAAGWALAVARQHQRAVVHGRGRAGRAGLGGPGLGRAQHRPEHHGRRHPAAARGTDHAGRRRPRRVRVHARVQLPGAVPARGGQLLAGAR
jgi:Major Facilitator Superfamily